MKKIIALLLALTMILSLAACGSSEGSTGTESATTTTPQSSTETTVDTTGVVTGEADPEATYLKEYKSAFSSAITSMNPYTTEFADDYVFIGNLVEGLVEADRYGRAVPCLAESWEHNDDYSVWTFKLKDGIYWVDNNGEKTEYQVTADDYVAGVRYIAEPNHSASNLSTIRGVIAGLYDYYYQLVDIDDGTITDITREDAEAMFDEMVGVKALDDLTVEYTLDGSYPFFLSYAQLDLLLPVEQAFLDQVGEDYGLSRDTLLCNGGYYISQWDMDKKVEFTKNPYYWDIDKITVDTLSWEYVADGISELEMFERGNLTSSSLSSEEVASVRGSEWEKYVYLSEKTLATYWYSFNFATRNPEATAAINNTNFRKAIFAAIDAVTLSAIWEPNNPEFFTRYTLLPEDCMFDENGVDYTDYGGLKAYKENDPFNPEEAKAYFDAAIAELCEADGVTLKGVEPGHVDMLPVAEFDVDGKLPITIVYSSGSSESEMKKATLVKQMLETYLGTDKIEVVLAFSSNSFSAEVYDLLNWDLVDDKYGFRYADPSANLDRCTSDYDISYSYYNIPEFDAMIEDASSTYETSDRYTKYAEAECYLLDNGLIKPYMTGGGSYCMTHIVPFTRPGGAFGMSKYKFKGALIREEPITNEEFTVLRAAYQQEKDALAK